MVGGSGERALWLLTICISSAIVSSQQLRYSDNESAQKKNFSFASYYGNHMVLQQAPKRATVWGYGSLGDSIQLTLDGETYSTQVVKGAHISEGGFWSVLLHPKKGGPYTISVTNNKAKIQLTDVLFGDVWVCSGQSNMQFTVSMMYNATEELAKVSQYTDIRVFTAAMISSSTPLYDLKSVEQPWSLPTKDSIGHKQWTHFSAVCWLYGRLIYEELKYPIGLIATDWGGTPIEAWSSPDALAKCNLTGQESQRSFKGPASNGANLWNAMIHPLLNMTIYGAIWYQGENNANANPEMYSCSFPAMISDWREKWYKASNQQTAGQFPFGFVQLSANQNMTSINGGFSEVRWGQTANHGFVPNYDMPNVFMAVTMDLPDTLGKYGSIHPRDKLDVGKRLSLSGMAVAYKQPGVQYQGPLPSAYYVDIGYRTLGIEYDNRTTTLQVRNKHGFEVCCSPDNTTVCDSSNLTRWADAYIVHYDEHMVTVSFNSSLCVGKWLMGWRYAWRETPCPFKKCAVYRKANELPAPPFLARGIFGIGGSFRGKMLEVREKGQVMYRNGC